MQWFNVPVVTHLKGDCRRCNGGIPLPRTGRAEVLTQRRYNLMPHLLYGRHGTGQHPVPRSIKRAPSDRVRPDTDNDAGSFERSSQVRHTGIIGHQKPGVSEENSKRSQVGASGHDDGAFLHVLSHGSCNG